MTTVAYLSMEIGLETAMPTYAGGLGVLAGDTVRSAADLGVSMVAVSLLHRKGYFQQALDAQGWQSEQAVDWPVERFARALSQSVQIRLEDRSVIVRAWEYIVKGISGKTVSVILLDTDCPENSEYDRTLTHYLYGGDAYYRLCQEAVLGIGGVRMLRALGYSRIARFHMNEGHASLLVLELIDELARAEATNTIESRHIDRVKGMCVFTTHTPVPAGHDKFSMAMARRVLGDSLSYMQHEHLFCCDSELNMTFLALEHSHFVNGVAKRHSVVSRQMLHHNDIDFITNGVHAATWASQPIQALYDRYIPGWREDNPSLRYAMRIPKSAVFKAHSEAKNALLERIGAMGFRAMEDTFTVGFARRATRYKRPDLLFHDVKRLQAIARAQGPVQILFAGKAHPNDIEGKQIIQTIYRMARSLNDTIHMVYLPEYDMQLGKLMTAGCDLWLNTPQAPLEASGTSGMKAAVNGVPSLSILDGWWVEGCIEGVTGWAIGADHNGGMEEGNNQRDAGDLYSKLENIILPMYYGNRDAFLEIMRHAIAINASFFNTERMLSQYVTKAYFM